MSSTSETFVHALARGSDEALFATSRTGRILWWGHVAQMLLGYPRVDTVGRSILAIAIAPPSVDLVTNAMREAAEGGAATCRAWLRARDGRFLPVPLDLRIEMRSSGATEELVFIAGAVGSGAVGGGTTEPITIPLLAPPQPTLAPVAARTAHPTELGNPRVLELEVREALEASHDPALMLVRVSRILVPTFADACRAYLHDATGTLERVASAGTIHEDDSAALAGVHDASCLVVRLSGRVRPLGAIVLRRADGRTFDEHEKRRALTIARITSLEIENARLIDMVQRARADSRRALERADRLLALSVALSGALTATQVADCVLEQAKRLVGADGVAIALLSQDRTSLEVVGTSGQVAHLFNAKRSFPVSAREPLADAGRSGHPVIIESTRAAIGQYEHLANAPAGAIVAFPLTADDRTIGSLAFRFPEPRSFSAEDQSDLRALTRHTSDAVERVRLYEAERRARAMAGEEARRLEVLADASRLLASPLDHPDMLQSFVRSLVPGLADWAVLYAATDEGLAPAAVHHRDAGRLEDLRALALLEARGSPSPMGPLRVRENERPQLLFQVPDAILSGLAPDERRAKLLRSVGITSQIAHPLGARGRSMGVLVLAYAGFRRYTPADVVFVEELARRMSLALDNARLYREVQDSEERYRLLVEGVQDHAIFLLDSEGRVASWNAGAERLFGYAAREVVGKPYLEVGIVEPGAPGIETARKEGRFETDGWLTRRDGSKFMANRLIQRLSPEGRSGLSGFAVIVRDLSERAKAREALEKARAQLAATEKLSTLGSLVSGVAHEIRTPLTVMSNNLHIMEMRIRSASTERKDDKLIESLQTRIGDAISGVDRLNHLVEDLRRFTRVKPGTRMRVPLQTIVEDATELFRAAQRGSLTVELSLDPTPPCEVDVIQLQQVVLNLLQNASEAMPHGGKVRVETGPHEPGFARVVVQDEGVGMPADVYARMFEEFFTTKPNGTGLGLSIVRRIVESHRGSITCDSTPGKGTRFVIALPTVE